MRLGIPELARLFEVSERTVYRWIAEDHLPTHEVEGDHRFHRAEVLEWATARDLTPAPEFFETFGASTPGSTESSLADAVASGGVHAIAPPQSTSDPAPELRPSGADPAPELRPSGADPAPELRPSRADPAPELRPSRADPAPELRPSRADTALAALLATLPLSERERSELGAVLAARPNLGLSDHGDGLALPHVRHPIIADIPHPVLAVCFLAHPAAFPGTLPADLARGPAPELHTLFLLVTPTVHAHLVLLSRLVHATHVPAVRAALARRASRDELVAALRALEHTAPAPLDTAAPSTIAPRGSLVAPRDPGV
jgi:PTS system nitrogen regulatory IIA component